MQSKSESLLTCNDGSVEHEEPKLDPQIDKQQQESLKLLKHALADTPTQAWLPSA